MRQAGKRTLLLFLVFSMLMSMMSVGVFADSATFQGTANENGTTVSTYSVTSGTVVYSNTFDDSSSVTGWTGAAWAADAGKTGGGGTITRDGEEIRGYLPSTTWKKGYTYQITADLKGSVAMSVNPNVNIAQLMDLKIGTENRRIYRDPNTRFNVTTDWKNYTFEWTCYNFVSDENGTETEATKAMTSVEAPLFYKPEADGILYIDNVKIVEIPVDGTSTDPSESDEPSVPGTTEGRTERITVYQEDFSDGNGTISGNDPMTLVSNGDGTATLKVDPEKAETFATYAHGTANKVTDSANLGNGAWKGGRWGTEFLHCGMTNAIGAFTLENGRKYQVVAEVLQKDANGSKSKPTLISQYVIDGKYFVVDGAQRTQYWGGFTVGNVDEDGFYPLTVNLASYQFVDSNGTAADATMSAFQFRTAYAQTVAELMAEKKLYCGAGTGAYDNSGTYKNGQPWGTGYTFTLDYSDFYGDETLGKGGSALVSSDMTEDQKHAVYDQYIYTDSTKATKKTWCLAYDCSFLYSPTRLAKLKDEVAKLDALVFNNWAITAEAEIYTISLSTGANGTVQAIVNPAITPEGSSISNSQVGVNVNDYFGVTFAFQPDNGHKIASVVYDGVDVTSSLVNDKLVIAPEDVKAATLTVTFEEGQSAPAPDASLTVDVQDSYITKTDSAQELVTYDFSTEAKVKAWTLGVDSGGDADKKVTDATLEWVQGGANGTTGALKHTANGTDYRPRLIGPDSITWKKGATYQITAYLKGNSARSGETGYSNTYSPWFDTSWKVNNNSYWNYGGKTLTDEWKKETWNLTINSVVDGNGSNQATFASKYYTRLGGNNVVGDLYIDEITISEMVPGYTKLGLISDKDMLFPGETAQLTVVGNNGYGNYKVANDGMTFTSMDETLATVSRDGVVTPKTDVNGTVRIKVTDGDLIGTIDLIIAKENPAKSELHVAKDGNDETGDGSAEAPFATLEKAKATIAGYARLPEGGVTVYVHEGEYAVSTTLAFTSKDSGTNDAPVTWTNYKDDEVTLTGATKVDASKIQKVTDETLLNRLIEQSGRDNLYMINLKDQGITLSELAPYGWGAADYPTRVFMNGTGLINARWPNDDKTGEWYFTGARGYATGEYTAAKLQGFGVTASDAAAIAGGTMNGNQQVALLKYEDPDNRTSKWTIKSGEAMVGGAIAYLWAPQNLRIDTLDGKNKIVKTKDKSAYGQSTYTAKTERYLYFSNIFEEIDMPGESYYDRATGILYFYPVGSVENASMEVSTMNSAIMTFSGASNITIDGIDIQNTRRNGVTITSSKDITIQNAELSGMSGDAVNVDKNSSNISINQNHMYDIGGVAVYIRGGDRTSLTSSGSVITGNEIHNVNHYYPSAMTAIQVEGVGHYIAHNKIYDINVQSIRFSETNNCVIEYNEFYDSELLNADGGVLYWGRNPSEFGNVVRNNYFHEIGGHIGAHGQQSVFTDDGNTGVAIYKNVIYNGGLPNFPLKTNGGQFHYVHDNIIINDNWATFEWPYTFLFQNWSNGGFSAGTKRQTSWWLYIQDLRSSLGGSNTNNFSGRKSLLFSDAWKEYYSSDEMVAENPLWKYAFETYFNETLYNEAQTYVSAISSASGTAKTTAENNFRTWLENTLPDEFNNTLEKNVIINFNYAASGNFNENNNLELTLDAGKALFLDFAGKNFNLSSSGLATVKNTISDFDAPEFDKMGLEVKVGGNNPVASNVTISGSPKLNGTLIANYKFTDADGDQEGMTKVYWYASDSKDGTYERIENGYGKYYTVSSEYEGKYIRCEVVPYDTKSCYGTAVASEDPIKISVSGDVDKTDLYAAITTVTNALAEAVIGNEPGQYPQAAVDTLTEALNAAREVALNESATTYVVEQATDTLEIAYNTFKLSVTPETANVVFDRVNVGTLLKNKENWVAASGQNKYMTWNDDGSLTIGGGNTGSTVAFYKGATYKNIEFSFTIKMECNEEDSKNGDEWAGIYLRQNDNDNYCWLNSGRAFMIDLKQNRIQLQKYPTSGTLPESIREDLKIELGKTYNVTVGLYDDAEKENVQLFVMTLNGVTIYSEQVNYDDLYNEAGYFVISSGNNTKLTISGSSLDTKSLDDAIKSAEEFTDTAFIGEDYGCYTSASMNSLSKAIVEANRIKNDDIASQTDVDTATLNLRQALINARAAFITSGTVSKDGTVAINYNFDQADMTAKSSVNDVTIKVDTNKTMPETTIKSELSELTIPAGTAVSGDFKAPLQNGSSPSAGFALGTVLNVYGKGASAVTTDQPVRIVLKNQSGKSVAYKNDKDAYTLILKSIKEDSAEAAKAALDGTNQKAVKMNVGSDLVIYTYQLSEFVIYVPADDSSTSPEPTVTPGGSSNGSTGNSGSGTTGATTSVGAAVVDKNVPFVDIVGHWAEEDIKAMYRRSIVSGIDDTHFDPDRSITRAEFAALVVRTLKLTAANSESVFEDVSNDAWYAKEVTAAAAAGLISGYDGYFRPDETITREEMAVVIMKAYVFLGKATATGKIDQFADKDEISAWAVDYVDQAVSTGMISGMTADTFAPKANATRAQVASLLKRLLEA